MILVPALVAILALLSGACAGYTESLNVTPLARNSLLVAFDFALASTPFPSSSGTHYGLFPKSVGQIVTSTHTRELHLRFAQGAWDAEAWGALPHGGMHSGGTGVEVWAWVEGSTPAIAERRWYELVNALSGLFCASLNFIDSTQTTQHPISFHSAALNSSSSAHLFHGALPRETVCTENLTPFIKLLPCKGRTGLSSLLDGHRIFDSKWQSMSLDFAPSCTPDEGGNGMCSFHMIQKVDVVLDVARSLQRKEFPVPRPPDAWDLKCNTSKPYHSDSICFPLATAEEITWSLSDIFGRKVQGTCLAADDTNSRSVCAQITKSWSLGWEGGIFTSSEDNNYCYQLKPQEQFDIRFETKHSSSVARRAQPPILARRSMTGRGQQNGGIHTIFNNPSATTAVSLVYFESLPWYMHPYMSTLNLTLDGPLGSVDGSPLLKDIKYRPFLERVRPTYLELSLEVPPSSSLSLSYDFDRSLLYLAEYPPDANRGFDVPPGIISVRASSDSDTFIYSTRTSSLLLSLPTPDFSMPYNVIILTSTVMALAFGTIFNILVRRFVYEDELAQDASAFGRLKTKCTRIFKRKPVSPGSEPR
ncbi:GPI transamidase component PIG-T [Limtongia smithiae]|uniref:GPI transamidase component PIG-T n=1 Tax=Limtongia smithiae TaxID=1125753 RepID=UPI0034CD17A4